MLKREREAEEIAAAKRMAAVLLVRERAANALSSYFATAIPKAAAEGKWHTVFEMTFRSHMDDGVPADTEGLTFGDYMNAWQSGAGDFAADAEIDGYVVTSEARPIGEPFMPEIKLRVTTAWRPQWAKE